MEELFDLRFHVGVLGSAEPGSEPELQETIDLLMRRIRTSLKAYNHPVYGFSGRGVSIDLFADTRLSGDVWVKSVSAEDMTLNYIYIGSMSSDYAVPPKAASVTSLCGATGHLDETGTALEWIVAQSDLIILLESEDARCCDRTVRSRLSGRMKDALCISIDARSPKEIQLIGHYSCEPFQFDQLDNYLRKLYPGRPKQVQQRSGTFFLSRLWHGCYQHFIRKYNARVVYEDHASEQLTGQALYLEEQFQKYDTEANGVASRYREAIYFRSILPFLSTLFLAIGFYLETLLGSILKFGDQSANIWMIAAGAGFLINALIGAYVYFMSRSKAVTQSQSGFLHARYIAEFLRVAKQFCPCGVPVSPYFVKDTSLMAQARDILRACRPENITIDSDNTDYIVRSTLGWIDGQIAYHQRTRLRFEKIVKRLGTFRESVFWTGFALVILRGLIQFIMPFVKDGIVIAYGSTWVGYIRSFANMLALLVPAWAGYFSSKLALNNFGGLYKHSDRAVQELKQLRHNVETLATKRTVTYEALMALSEDVLSTQIAEVDDWYAQTAARTVERS